MAFVPILRPAMTEMLMEGLMLTVLRGRVACRSRRRTEIR
jgi:hypothetical protein